MKMKFVTGALLMSISTSLLALPTIYPKNPLALSSVVNTTNSNLIADHHDPKLFHVMPPNTATSIVKGLHSITANVGFCGEMADLQAYSKKTSALLADLAASEIKKSEQFELLIQELSDERLRMAESVANHPVRVLGDIDEQIELIDQQTNEIISALESCVDNCQELRAQYKDLREERKKQIQDRRAIVKQYANESKIYEQGKARVAAVEQKVEALMLEWDNLKNRLNRTRASFVNLYKELGMMSGASASITFDSLWDDNVDILRLDNPHLAFQKIDTQLARITTNIKNFDSVPSHNGILGYAISGEYENGVLTLSSYPEDLNGNILLSLIGTCPMLHPQDFEINVPNGTDEMEYGMVIAYEYPTLFSADVTMTYNMYKMYQKIQESSSRGGGFFRKRRVTNSVTERNTFRDSFNVKWNDHLGLSQEKKDELESQMRERVFSRMALLALPNVVSTGELKLPTPPQSGAVVLADGLNKICGVNKWCQGASLAVSVLDSLFGSSSATASYTNIQDVKVSERWSTTELLWRPWVTSYN